jgi:hypothetical protein
MGNMVPKLCVCDQREGKNFHKRSLRFTINDEKIRIFDYTGILLNVSSLKDSIKILQSYVIYEISCIKDFENGFEHSVVKAKCFNIDNLYGVLIKIVFMTIGKVILHIFPVWEDDEFGMLEMVCKGNPYKVKIIQNKVSNLGTFVAWLDKIKDKPEDADLDNPNLGKAVYYLLKSIIEEEYEE